LADSLQAITGESVRLHSNGPGKPLLVKDTSDDSFFYLAMPMNR
jgi:DNA polymerase III sliding clamp (beta) subunit (PCNA family)